MKTIDRQHLADLHRRSWSGFGVWLAFVAAFAAAEAALCWSLLAGPLWLTVLLVLLVAHLMHSQLLAFHEAVHWTLCPQRGVNEWMGISIGTLSLTSLSAFRALHRTHHAHLATERDEELWPFVLPETPRWARRVAAGVELSLGIAYTSYLCWRTFLRAGSPIRGRVRRRVWFENALIFGWAALLVCGVLAGLGPFLLVMYAIPGILAGNMHSLRKYIEHMGLTGSTVLGSTRSVAPTGVVGRLFTFSLFNISFHGIHHRFAAIPQERLPELADLLTATTPEEVPPYTHHRGALRDLCRSLGDPRIGAQWLRSN